MYNTQKHYQEDLQTFIQKVKKLLTRKEFITPPKNLFIVIGEANCTKLAQIREKIPLPTFILYIYQTCSEDEEKEFLKKADDLCLIAIPLSQRSYYADKVGVLVTIFHNLPRQLLVEKEMEKKYPSEVMQVRAAIEIAVEMQTHIMMRGLVWMRSAIANLGFILQHGKYVNKIPSFEKPPNAIVLGAGPSLVEDLAILKHHRAKFLLISVGHAFPILYENNIIPDIVVEIDSYVERNWKGFSGEIPEQTLLVATPEVAPEVPLLFKKHLWITSGYPIIVNWFNAYGVSLLPVHIDKTVSIVAIDLAIKMGIKRIVLLGQDMALDTRNRLYKDEEPVDRIEPLTFVEGYEGVKLAATDTLVSLREGMESYIENITSSNPAIEIINCTKRGAVIRGTKRDSLEHIIQTEDSNKPLLSGISLSESAVSAEKIFSVLSKQKDAYGNVIKKLDQIIKELVKVKDTLPESIFNNLHKLTKEEEAFRETAEGNFFLNQIYKSISYFEDFMFVRYGKTSQQRVKALINYYLFYRDTVADIEGDLEQIFKGSADTNTGKPILNPKVFKSFRNYACNFISYQNPEFGKWLIEHPAFEYDEKQFSIKWQHQYLPFMSFKDSTNRWKQLSASNVVRWGDEVVEEFMNKNNYEPEKDAVIFWIGCNWLHICAFGKRFPNATMLVLEPYVDLFSYLINRCMFLHLLPPTTLIIGLHNDLTEALHLYRMEIEKWKKENKRILLFEHPILKQNSSLPPQFSIS